MKKLVTEYQEHDKELNDRIAEYQNNIDFITSIEEIGETLNSLRVFLSEFDTQDPRYNLVQGIANRYRQLYDQITVDWFQEKRVSQW